MLRQYQSVLRLGGAKGLLAWSLASRGINIPIGAITLIVAYGATDSWTWAGIAGALCTLGAALSTWIFGRLMDRFGVRRVLLWSSPGNLTMLGLALLAEGNLETCLWAAAVGLTRPATGAGLRSTWASLIKEPENRATAYAMESGLVPVAGALGAAAAGLLAGAIGAQQMGVPIALVALVANLGLANCKAVKSCQAEDQQPRSRQGARLGARSWAAIIGIGAAWASLAAVEVGLGAEHGPEELGLLTAVGMISVLLGAHTFSTLSQKMSPLSWVTLGLLIGVGASAVLGAGLTLLGMIVIGASRGLVSPSASTALSQYAPRSRQSEAMALYGSVLLLGQAAGRPAGALLLELGSYWPMVAAGAFSLVAALYVSWVRSSKQGIHST